MKKIYVIMAVLLAFGATNVSGQSELELLKQQKQINDARRKMLEVKPTKEAKKKAKAFAKQGWQVPAGEKSLELMQTQSETYGEAVIADENGQTVKRYLMHTSMSTSGSYNTGFAAARAAALSELASLVETTLVEAWQITRDNAEQGQGKTITNDKFNDRVKAVVSQSLTNVQPFMKMYRQLPNGNYEVQVRLAYDKQELMARLKRNLQKQLEDEGEQLNGVVDNLMDNFLHKLCDDC